MDVNTLEVSDAQSFINSLGTGGNIPNEKTTEQIEQEKIAETEKSKLETQGSPDINQGETKDKSKEFLENLDKEKKTKEEEISLSGIDKISEQLVKDGFLFKFDDDTVPTNYEELKLAIEQSNEAKDSTRLQKAWDDKVKALPSSLKKIHEYADSGVTTASEIENFIHKVSYSEQISALDPKKPEDQERIVTLQLLLTGLDETAAMEQVADYKALNKLENLAGKFYPNLKRKADDQLKIDQQNIDRRAEDIEMYTSTNAQHVAHFIENTTDILPFKITSDKYKNAIFQLAATPLGVRDDGEIVFGWEEYVRGLQSGNEDQFKEYIDIMAFIANKKAYKDAYAKTVSNDTSKTNFKKIKSSELNKGSLEQEYQEPMRISKQPVQQNNWALQK